MTNPILLCCKATGPFGNVWRATIVSVLVILPASVNAASGVWVLDPVNGDWNTPANWSSNTVPNGGGDAAAFALSHNTAVSISASIAVFGLSFNTGSSAFSITAFPGNSLSIGDGGISNLSGVAQNFVAETNDAGQSGSFIFNGGSVGDGVAFTEYGASLSGVQGGSVYFSSTFESANAGPATFRNLGGAVSGASGGIVGFQFHANAAESTIINEGGQVSGAGGGLTLFQFNNPSAATATIIANGGVVNGADGAAITFYDGSLADNSTLIANGGVSGGIGGTILFLAASNGGTSRVEVFGNGNLDLRQHNAQPPMTIGSLEGDGVVFLNQHSLTIGGNSLNTGFSGVIQGNGSVVKAGTGTLTFFGENLYSGGTTVTQGVLIVSNSTGSGAGTGAVNVNAGSLGGSGTIAGVVTIGTGSGTGAFLAPAAGGKKQLILTIQSALTFKTDATYTYTFKAKQNKARADKVIANGVTVNTGAVLSLSGQTQGSLRQGLTLTLISNTSANPISGTFSNLPDGAIVNVNGNNLQASYEGGDGNDLTLTAVP